MYARVTERLICVDSPRFPGLPLVALVGLPALAPITSLANHFVEAK